MITSLQLPFQSHFIQMPIQCSDEYSRLTKNYSGYDKTHLALLTVFQTLVLNFYGQFIPLPGKCLCFYGSTNRSITGKLK